MDNLKTVFGKEETHLSTFNTQKAALDYLRSE